MEKGQAMNEIQQRAFEIYLDSATFESDYKPITEEQLAKKLQSEGLKASSSAINRWKAKFNWADALKNKVTLAMSTDKQTKNLLQASSLQSAVKNTKVDIERNNVLIAASYEFFEIEAAEILQRKKNGERISEEERSTMKFVATLSTTRHDKMLDRLAIVPPDAVSAQDIIDRFKNITLEVEDDSIEAHIIEDKTSDD